MSFPSAIVTVAALLALSDSDGAPLQPWNSVAARNPHAQFGETRFSNLTQRQFKSLQRGAQCINTGGNCANRAADCCGGLLCLETYPPSGEPTCRSANVNTTTLHRPADLPTAKDWAEALTPVKDQGNCGSCWAHAAVEQVESYVKLAGQPLQALSVQQVVSCDTLTDNCNGGNFNTAASYIHSSGLMSESDYSYVSGSLGCGFGGTMGSDNFCITSEMGSSGRCLSVPNHCPNGQTVPEHHRRSGFCFDGQCNTDYFGCCLTEFTGHEDDLPTSDSITKNTSVAAPSVDMPINTGAQCSYNAASATTKIQDYSYVAGDEAQFMTWIAQNGPLQISIDATDLQHYSSGIMTSCNSGSVDHDVQLVGYGVDNGINYWKVRNSWGSSWGEQGFFRVKRDVNSCSMATYSAGYPTV